MIRKFILAMSAVVALGGVARAAPLEAYGKLPNIERATLSPSGAKIAYVTTNGDSRSIVVQTTADRKTMFVGAVGLAKVRRLTWVGDDHLILTSSTARTGAATGRRREHFIATQIDLRSGQTHVVLDKVHEGSPKDPKIEVMNVLGGYPQVRQIDGKPTLFVYTGYLEGGTDGLGVFKIDLDTNEARLFDKEGTQACDLLLGADGHAVVLEDCNDQQGLWTLKVKSPGGVWRTAQKIAEAIDGPNLIGVVATGDAALIEFRSDADGHIWRRLDLTTGAWGDSAVSPDGHTPIVDPWTGRIIGEQALDGDAYTLTFDDPAKAAIWKGVSKAFPGDIVSLVSWSEDWKKLVVRVDSAEQGPAYALVDLNTGDADWLGAEYVGLKAEDISPVKPVRYKTADGLEINGYLTLPRGREPKGLPLVVLPHGGPQSRDTPGFDWWAQALASHGYAVLQPNFRGSTGYGWTFQSAGFGEWGRKMQTDLSDGVRHLAAEGIIDPKRVCIVGGSYGGYAALAGAALDHGVYRCAVSYAGVSDLKGQIMGERADNGDFDLRYQLRYVGAKGLDDPVLAQYSPAAHAAAVDIPVLLIHGRDDTVVSISQSRRMADAMRAAGKPVELIEMPGEDHWLSSGATRLQMLQATVTFLEKYNPPN
jgi:dipeptidyl aminopeptidase/acylaminoacyl peptidase